MEGEMIRAVVADDEKIIREGIAELPLIHI